LTALYRLRSSARKTLYSHGAVEASPVVAEERMQSVANDRPASRHTAETFHVVVLCTQSFDLGIVRGDRSLDRAQLLDNRQCLLPFSSDDNCRHRRRAAA